MGTEDYSKTNIECSASACNKKEVTGLSSKSLSGYPMIPSIKQAQSIK